METCRQGGIEKLLDWGQLSCVCLLSVVVVQQTSATELLSNDTNAVVWLTLFGFAAVLLSNWYCCFCFVFCLSTMVTIVLWWGREKTFTAPMVICVSGGVLDQMRLVWKWTHQCATALWCAVECGGVKKTFGFSVGQILRWKQWEPILTTNLYFYQAGWARAAGWLSACYLNNVVSK